MADVFDKAQRCIDQLDCRAVASGDACLQLCQRTEEDATRAFPCRAGRARRHFRNPAVGAERVYCDCCDWSSWACAGLGVGGATTWRFA